MTDLPEPSAPKPSFTVAHAADFYRRYPGETVTFFTRVDVQQALAGFILRIAVPEQLEAGASRASANHDGTQNVPHLVVVDDQRYFTWTLQRPVFPGERFEYQLEATVSPILHDVEASSRAVVRPIGPEDNPTAFQAETITIALAAQGRLLKHLPALYTEYDEMMGRFVMLFESFWEPITDRIDHIEYYLDPKFTPPDLLPWLATWVDLVLDEQWPEEKRRRLLSAMVSLYRQRGTRHGLQAYLEIYTGQKAQITEHRAHNFQLGPFTHLGPSMALGKRNEPFTFRVTLRLPPTSTEEQRRERQRKIEAIVESEKPAHTGYTLHIEEA